MANPSNSETPASGPAAKSTAATRAKKKIWRHVGLGRVYIQCSFNNTLVTVTDEQGNVIVTSSAGANGFKGTKKGTPFAAQVTADAVARKALDAGVKQVQVLVKGPGSGRETAIRAIQGAGLVVVSIRDVTPIPHDGCRPRKARRV